MFELILLFESFEEGILHSATLLPHKLVGASAIFWARWQSSGNHHQDNNR